MFAVSLVTACLALGAQSAPDQPLAPVASINAPQPQPPAPAPALDGPTELGRVHEQRLDLLQQQIVATNDRIREAEAKARDASAKADKAESIGHQFEIGGWVLIPIIAILGLAGIVGAIIGWGRIKKFCIEKIELKFTSMVDAQLKEKVEQRLHHLAESAEKELLKLSEVLALRHSRHFDEALIALGWKDDVTALRKLKPVFRRAVIECLFYSALEKEKRRDKAWASIQELWQDDRSPETLVLFMKLATKRRAHADAVQAYDEGAAAGFEDKQCDLLAATCLRKLGKLSEALKKALKYKTDPDLHAVNTVASLYRDLGEFDHAHDLLRPKVEALLRSRAGTMPDGWAQVLNSFVASCIDRNRPDDGVAAADFLLRNQKHPVSAFNAALLATTLAKENPHRKKLIDTIERILPDLPVDDASEKAEALVLLARDELVLAIATMRRSIGALESLGSARVGDLYFSRCLLARLLRTKGERREAITILQQSATKDDFGGEAIYELALTYAEDGNEDEAARWLRHAAQDRPLWAARARDHEVLSGLPKVIEVLGDLAQARVLVTGIVEPRLNFVAADHKANGESSAKLP